MIWATRGRSWGFRFLARGGFDDPIHTYEQAFHGAETQQQVCRRRGPMVAVRFPDPEDRRDAAGRVIPHDFVILGPESVVERIDSIETARDVIWPEVAETFALVWLSDEPPRLDSDTAAR